jgi:hypothetical protein
MTRTTQKRLAWDRLQRLIAHRDNPAAPVDAATLLRAEADRLRQLGHPIGQRMAWAMSLAAAKLDAVEDPATRTRFKRCSGDPVQAAKPTLADRKAKRQAATHAKAAGARGRAVAAEKRAILAQLAKLSAKKLRAIHAASKTAFGG